MHDTHDVRKSAELEKACEDKRLHDLEHIVCGACGVEDHNATMCLEVTFDKEEVT